MSNKNNTNNNNTIADLIAGISIAGLLLPEAVAYSSIANMPAQAGIVGLFAGLLSYWLFGKSRFAIVSATSSSAALLAASVLPLAGGDVMHRLVLSAGLVLMAGGFFLLAAAARLGSITDFIAKPVLRGFSFGLAVVIAMKQLASMVAVKPEHSDVPRYLYGLLANLANWNWYGLLMGLTALLLMRLLAKFRTLPAGLFVIALSVLLGQYIDFSAYKISLVGAIDFDHVSLAVPALSIGDWQRLFQLGAVMVLIIYTESYGSIRTFALKHGDSSSPNRDLMALGVSNVISGLFQGMPVGAGFSGTAANEAAGAVSKKASLIAAGVVLLIMLALLPWIKKTPEPILAAIVIHAISHSMRLENLSPYFTWKRDRVVVLVVIAGVFTIGVLDGLLLGIGISLLLVLKRFSEAGLTELGCLHDGHDYLPIGVNNEVKRVSNVTILRPNEPLFFANIDRVISEVKAKMRSVPSYSLVLSLEETPNLDSSSLEGLGELMQLFEANKQLLVLARLKDAPFSLVDRVYGHVNWQYVFLSRLSVDEAVGLVREHLVAVDLPCSSS